MNCDGETDCNQMEWALKAALRHLLRVKCFRYRRKFAFCQEGTLTNMAWQLVVLWQQLNGWVGGWGSRPPADVQVCSELMSDQIWLFVDLCPSLAEVSSTWGNISVGGLMFSVRVKLSNQQKLTLTLPNVVIKAPWFALQYDTVH